MGWRVGVDIGGSFTDFALLNDTDGSLHALKVFSRPDQPGQEIVEGLRQLEQRHGITAAEIAYFTHGTTVGVNSVIQRKGLRLGLFTTAGFIDVLELARLKSADMYNLFARRPVPLVPRERVFPVAGRIGADGAELAPLDPASVRAALDAARAAGCEGVVVSLLHGYRNPSHEQAVRAIAASHAPGLPVFLASETWPIIREYERTVTAVIGGYVQPRVAHYLDSLQTALREAGVRPEPRITKSNGGVMTAEQGKTDCVQMILSGTASGVIGAAFVARAAGVKQAMSLDIGGTSADVALLLDGEPQYGVGETIGEFQIFIPSVSVSSIGEGGGSIAWIDPLGVLKVGPESAGSTPGPVCYGRGGTRPTVTDSFVACGLIGAEAIGYSAVQVDVTAARAAFADLATQLGSSIEQVAEAVQSICVSGMYTGISALVSRYGVDPRDFTMIAFGGAGPMLAPMLARTLGLHEVLVPRTPGVLSALGGLVADLKNDFIRTIYVAMEPAAATALRDGFATLTEQGRAWLEGEPDAGDPVLLLSADMRYAGQSFEIEVPLDAQWIERGDIPAMIAAFHDRHEALFGHCDRRAAVQAINLRLVAQARSPQPTLPELPPADGPAVPAAVVAAWLDGAKRDVPLFRRETLRPGHAFDGPAIVAQEDCTTIVPPQCAVLVDAHGNLRITVGGSKP